MKFLIIFCHLLIFCNCHYELGPVLGTRYKEENRTKMDLSSLRLPSSGKRQKINI